jgi:hypothetical protein
VVVVVLLISCTMAWRLTSGLPRPFWVMELKPMFDLVPFTGSRWKVANPQGEFQLVRQVLQGHLPQTRAATVAAATVGRDQPGHRGAAATILSVSETGMVVQFEDRADTTTIRFAQREWIDFLQVTHAGKKGVAGAACDPGGRCWSRLENVTHEAGE